MFIYKLWIILLYIANITVYSITMIKDNLTMEFTNTRTLSRPSSYGPIE